MPRPFSGCQIKAEIKGFLLMYHLGQYKHWFLPNFEPKDPPEYTVTPSISKFIHTDFYSQDKKWFVGFFTEKWIDFGEVDTLECTLVKLQIFT
jgi:hypothetical protein